MQFLTPIPAAKENKVKFQTFDGTRLVATEFKPVKPAAKAGPAILLVEGSGKSPAKGDTPSSPFYQLGRALARSGFYVLTYNKRGSGLNTDNSSFYKSSFWTDNKDAQAALNFVKSRTRVNPKQIFLMGQSMGGVHISFLAQVNKIAGSIYFAAPFKNFVQTLRQQNAAIFRLMGKSAAEATAETKKIMAPLLAVKNGSFKRLYFKDVCRKIDGATIIHGVQEEYIRDVFKLDSAAELAKLAIPILVIQGTSDFVVNINDFNAAKTALKKYGRKNCVLKLLPKVDHIFSEQPTKAASLKYMKRIGTGREFLPVSGRVVAEVLAFLGKHR